MKTRNLMFALALAFGIPAAGAQVISYSPRTGDVWVDSQLGYYNDYGRDYRDNYVDDIVSTYGAPRYLVEDLLTTRHWNPGDVYYACALAYQTRRSCGDVVNMYDQDRGQGWGVVAQRLGIKPGSAEFQALKGQMGKSKTRYTTYSTLHADRVDHAAGMGKGKHAVNKNFDNVDAPGHAGKAKGNAGGKGNSGKGNSGKGNSGKGNSGKGSSGKGKGH
jgi:hypothetical protein